MHKYKGALIAHIGPMFGGKTSGWASDVRKMQIAKYKVAAFKPFKDSRYSEEYVVTHDGLKVKAINVKTFIDIVRYLENHRDINVVAIDEFQFISTFEKSREKEFLDKKISAIDFLENKFTVNDFIKWIIKSNKTLIISGLDLDSDLEPFDNVKEFLPFATHIIKHKAVCVQCGADATTSFCKVHKDTQELIGGQESYEPRCLKCFMKEKKNNEQQES